MRVVTPWVTLWDCPFQDTGAAKIITFYWISYSSLWENPVLSLGQKGIELYVVTQCTTLNKLIIDEREGEALLCPPLALYMKWMVVNRTDSQKMTYSFERFITNESGGWERGAARSLRPIRSSQTRDVSGREKDMSQLSTSSCWSSGLQQRGNEIHSASECDFV